MKTVLQIKHDFLNLLDRFENSRLLHLFSFNSHKDLARARQLRDLLSKTDLHDQASLLRAIHAYAKAEHTQFGTSALLQKIWHRLADELGMDKNDRHHKSLESMVYASACAHLRPIPFYQKIELRLQSLS